MCVNGIVARIIEGSSMPVMIRAVSRTASWMGYIYCFLFILLPRLRLTVPGMVVNDRVNFPVIGEELFL